MAALRLAILALLLAFSAASASVSPHRPRPGTSASHRRGKAALPEHNADEDEFELQSTETEVKKQREKNMKMKKAAGNWKVKERISLVRKVRESSVDSDANGDEDDANGDEGHDITANLVQIRAGKHGYRHGEVEEEEEEDEAVFSKGSREETSEKLRGRHGYRHREVEEEEDSSDDLGGKIVSSGKLDEKVDSSDDTLLETIEENRSHLLRDEKVKVRARGFTAAKRKPWKRTLEHQENKKKEAKQGQEDEEEEEEKIVSSDELDEKGDSSDDDLIETKEENRSRLLHNQKMKAGARGSSAAKRRPLKVALEQQENENKEEKQEDKEAEGEEEGEEGRGQKAREPAKMTDKEVPLGEKVVQEKADSLADTQAKVPAGKTSEEEIAANAAADSADDVVGADVDDLVADHNMLGPPILDWDEQRQRWLADHPEVGPTMKDGRERLFILTGTQPSPCPNPSGDHLLLRCFKNKVDYSRLHQIDMFYNVALLDPHMYSFWAKLPVVRATMLAHPEVEWIWWLDADAVITDMEFEIPLHKYKDYNMVVHGWESVTFEKRSWLGLNAGSFLLRNCQWSMDLLERWASMGPQGPMGEAYRDILSDFLPDRPRNPTDDQAALVYLMAKERDRWATKLRMELDFYLSGYWLMLMDGFEATEAKYQAMEAAHPDLRALVEGGHVSKERLLPTFARAREGHLEGAPVWERRPFITHFTGCQPCSSHHNPIYTAEQCHMGLIRALNCADDQVLRAFGFRHRTLNVSDLLPLTSHPLQ